MSQPDISFALALGIGLGIGGLLLLIAIIAIIVYCCKYRKESKRYQHNLTVEAPDGYTTFSLQKPGMPPMPTNQGRPSSHLGGIWTTPVPPPTTVTTQKDGEVKPKNGKAIKRKESSKSGIDAAQKRPDSGIKQQKGKAKSSAVVTECHTSSESIEGFNTGSLGSQVELITRDRKQPGDKNEDKERKKSAAFKASIHEPDMSVIAEEAVSKISINTQRHSSNEEPSVPHVQVIHVGRQNQPESQFVEQSSSPRQTIYPPDQRKSDQRKSDTARVDVDAVVETEPKTHQRLTMTMSEDKRMIVEAFSFLDEIED